MTRAQQAMQAAVEKASFEVIKAIEDGELEIHEILSFLKDNSQYVMPKMTATMQKTEITQPTKIEGLSEEEQQYLNKLNDNS